MASSAAAAYEDDHIPTRERKKKKPTNVSPGSPLRAGENAPLSTHGTERLHSAASAPLPALYPGASEGDVRPLQPLHLSLHRSLPLSFFSLSLSLPHKRINTIASNAPAWHVCYATAVRHAVSHWAHFIYPFFKQRAACLDSAQWKYDDTGNWHRHHHHTVCSATIQAQGFVFLFLFFSLTD